MPRWQWCLIMAGIIGGLGFLGGFVGPMILDPTSPQGPLLGIFFTGPAGVVLGAVAGFLIGTIRKAGGAGASRRARHQPPADTPGRDV